MRLELPSPHQQDRLIEYDRALYLSSIHQRPFLDKRNWGGLSAFQSGVMPSLLQRVIMTASTAGEAIVSPSACISRQISYGIYFPVEEFFAMNLWKSGGIGCVCYEPVKIGQFFVTNLLDTNSGALVLKGVYLNFED